MLKSLFILPDGSEIFSGVHSVPAIQSVKYSFNINPATNLNFEAASSAIIQVSMIDTSGVTTINVGTTLHYYTVDEGGNRQLRGVFRVEETTKPSSNKYTFVAYDRMTLFDSDVTEWLLGLDSWPYSINDLLERLCAFCGVEFSSTFELTNGDYLVEQFIGQLTGRQVLKWIAGANASYAYMTPDGLLSFKNLGDPIELSLPRRSSKLSDFTTSPIVSVSVKQTDTDIGVSWPEDTEGEVYSIVGNPLLATDSVENLQPYVARLADKLVGVSYTPATLDVFDSNWICGAGNTYRITDLSGESHDVLIFAADYKGGMSNLRGTGTSSRQSSTAVNFQNVLGVVQGKVAQIEATVERVSVGLSATNITLSQVQESTTLVSQTANDVALSVSTLEYNTEQTLKDMNERVTDLASSVEAKVDANKVSLQIKQELQAGVGKVKTSTGYTFDESGLTVSKTDSDISTRVTQDGMEVLNRDTTTLQANSAGVFAKNLRATTYLIIGDRSRFENYGSNRTGCFWIGRV